MRSCTASTTASRREAARKNERRHVRECGRQRARGGVAGAATALSQARGLGRRRDRGALRSRPRRSAEPDRAREGRPFMWDFLSRMFPPDSSTCGARRRDGRDGADRGLGHADRDRDVDSALVSRCSQHQPSHRRVPSHAALPQRAARDQRARVRADLRRAVGLGPFAGVLAIALHATGMLAKFCAEEVEGVDKGPIEAMQATGGSRMQVILFGIVPQDRAAFISYSIYRLDVSIRAATVLGLVGAGGLGFSLIKTMKLFKYHQTATCILVIFVLVLVSDWICGKLRRQVI